MIEIKELVIRANVNGSGNGSRQRPSNDSTNRETKGCCEENIDLMLKIINDKNER